MKEKVTKDDVARLIRGKPSINRVGSRSVSHRLRADELKKLEVANLRGYLLINGVTRAALKNSWYLACQAKDQACFFVRHVQDGWFATVVTNTGTQETFVSDLSMLPKLLSAISRE